MSPASPITPARRLPLAPSRCAWPQPPLPACRASAGTLTPNLSGILGVTKMGFSNTRCSYVPSQAGSPKAETHCPNSGDRGRFPVRLGVGHGGSSATSPLGTPASPPWGRHLLLAVPEETHGRQGVWTADKAQTEPPPAPSQKLPSPRLTLELWARWVLTLLFLSLGFYNPVFARGLTSPERRPRIRPVLVSRGHHSDTRLPPCGSVTICGGCSRGGSGAPTGCVSPRSD